MTTRFTYKVTVEVEDDLGMPIECYNENWWHLTDNDLDEDGNVTARWLAPETMAEIVMIERISHEEDYGFDYSVEWERTNG